MFSATVRSGISDSSWFGAAPLGAPVNQPQPTRWLGRADVLGDGKIRDWRQFLKDGDDAGADGIGGAGEPRRFTIGSKSSPFAAAASGIHAADPPSRPK
jgi:hypothetical protein